MWKQLNAVASQAKQVVKNVASEALETAQELRAIHQVWSEPRGINRARGAVIVMQR
jgi:hypothetical protein